MDQERVEKLMHGGQLASLLPLPKVTSIEKA